MAEKWPSSRIDQGPEDLEVAELQGIFSIVGRSHFVAAEIQKPTMPRSAFWWLIEPNSIFPTTASKELMVDFAKIYKSLFQIGPWRPQQTS